MAERTVVDATTTTGVHAADGATNAGPSMAIQSQEQIYSPIQIRKVLLADSPGFEIPIVDKGSAWKGPFGGLFMAGFGQHGPTCDEYNPYFAKLYGGDGTYWMGNVDFHLVANNGETDDGDMDLNLDKLNRNTVETVQINAMRGPLLLSGFGVDAGDLPVPARGAEGEDMYAFDVTAPNDRRTWKSGPVAVKWDDERKVWEGGPQIVCGYADEDIAAPKNPCDPEVFKMNVFRRCSPVGAYPALLTDCYIQEQIKVVNRDPSLSQELVEGMVFVVAVRINYEWIPIWVGCPEGEGCVDDPGCTKACNDSCEEPCTTGGDDECPPGTYKDPHTGECRKPEPPLPPTEPPGPDPEGPDYPPVPDPPSDPRDPQPEGPIVCDPPTLDGGPGSDGRPGSGGTEGDGGTSSGGGGDSGGAEPDGGGPSFEQNKINQKYVKFAYRLI